ncbi:MAG TPA: tRNA pseudouridine(38-40) synthase TruA [Gemmatimonadales bacterium]|nr:tRNA pseudouridine(38-40) synthase TruA [Gemmatimonadales bacterium]
MDRAFLLIVEFDGTRYAGWQRQPDALTVQSVMEAALGRLAGSDRKAIAAGRTDAGVHALGMPVSVTMPPRWTCAELQRAVNAVLPRDVAVREVRAVVPGTDARRSATGRRYRYDVVTATSARSPFRSRVAWPLGRQLDLPRLHRAAALLPGTHDFRAFAVVGEPKPHYRCHIVEARWDALDDGLVRFTVAADRFLHHMVRMLVGTMVDIGLDRRPEGDMARLLTLTHNTETSAPAPACGLSFMAATYPESIWLEERAAW